MATIRPIALPAAGSVNPAAAIIIDDGSVVEKATPLQIIDAAIPLASQADAEAGSNNVKRMTPLRVAQAIDALGLSAELVAQTTDFGTETVGIGSGALDARLTIQTNTAFTGNAQHIYHYGDQATVDNQTNALAVHNYTNAKAVQIDNLGNKVALSLKQALNDTAWPAHGVGTGDFWEALRARTSGAGNTGDGVDILAKFDKQGLLRFYGSDGEDWDGTDTTAPIIFGSYTGFFTKAGYLGWDEPNEQMIIGSIESGVAFKPVQFACSALRVLGDGTVPFGTSVNPLSTVHTYRVNKKPVAVALLPAAATAGAGADAFVSDSTVAAAGNFGAVVAGGGANGVPVYSDGTNWRIG